MTDTVNKIESIAIKYGVDGISNILIKNEKFGIWSGSSKPHRHHYGEGGLAKHTLEVIELCIQTNTFYNNVVDNQHLILAALFHDSGKMFDYIRLDNNEWVKTNHARKIHHITKSALIWHDAVIETGLFKDVEEEITHAILSHHGLREWGSPVYPSTKLSWMVHLCDGISARINDCDKFDIFTK